MVIGSRDAGAGSRRELLAGSLAALAGGALIAGCGGSSPPHAKPHNAATVAPADVAILNGLLDLENHAIAAYTAGIPLLQRPVSKAAVQFLSQELSHAGSLEVLIRRAGAEPIKPRASYDLGHPGGPSGVLALLHRVEQLQLTAYLEMIPRLSTGHVRAAVASIFANDAQHVAVLRSELGLVADPSAFVTGGE